MPDTGSFRHGLDVNVIGAVLGMKHSIAALRKRGGGSIVLNSSQAGGASRGLFSGVIGDLTIINAYCLTSAAIDQLVRMAAYYQNENIRVYGLKPAIFKSDMSDEWVKLGRESGFSPDMDDEILADFNFFFKGIMGDPKHIGCVVEVRPCPNRDPRAYHPTHIDPHVTRLGCGVFRIASTPPSQPPTNTCTQTHTYDDPNL